MPVVVKIGPQFIHESECCQFLGRFGETDLYYCDSAYKTVIYRFSSDGPDYTSSLAFVGVIPEITEAARRAVDRGLLDPKTQTGRGTIEELLDGN